MIHWFVVGFGIWISLCAVPIKAAEMFILPPDDIDLVGEMRMVPAQHDDTLLDIARRYHLGHDEIILANPDLDRWLPGEGTEVVLPTRYILPRAPRSGLVLNVPEMRVYHYPDATENAPRTVQSYPVSVGRMDWATPLGEARVSSKQKDPAWRPPESIRREAAERGEILPQVVPAGPQNPLGKYALRLSIPGYLIHGTDKPWGIGMRVTHGCLRLYPEHIETLYQKVAVGTPVQIVNQPVKAGWLLDTLYIEVHPPLEEDVSGRDKLLHLAMDAIRAELGGRNIQLSGRLIRKAVEEQRGYPVAISDSNVIGMDE